MLLLPVFAILCTIQRNRYRGCPRSDPRTMPEYPNCKTSTPPCSNWTRDDQAAVAKTKRSSPSTPIAQPMGWIYRPSGCPGRGARCRKSHTGLPLSDSRPAKRSRVDADLCGGDEGGWSELGANSRCCLFSAFSCSISASSLASSARCCCSSWSYIDIRIADEGNGKLRHISRH